MKDIEIAKELLKKEDYTLVVIKEGDVLFISKEKGIKPMYSLIKNMKEEAKGASIADKVIGRGAALLSNYVKIKEVFGEVISKEAVEVLEENNIDYSFSVICDYIKNRDKTGLCPIENLSLGQTDVKVFIEELESFFKSK